MSSKKKLKSTGEIDLYALFQIIFSNLTTIIVILIIFLIMGISSNYKELTDKKFTVSVPYNILYHPLRIKEMCSSNFACLNKETAKNLLRLINEDWKNDEDLERFHKVTDTPLTREKYYDQFNEANLKLTQEIFDNLQSEILAVETIISNLDLDQSKQLNILSDNFRSNKRLITDLEKGKKAVYFGNISINQIKKSPVGILISWVILGASFALVFIFFKHNFNNRKKS